MPDYSLAPSSTPESPCMRSMCLESSSFVSNTELQYGHAYVICNPRYTALKRISRLCTASIHSFFMMWDGGVEVERLPIIDQ